MIHDGTELLARDIYHNCRKHSRAIVSSYGFLFQPSSGVYIPSTIRFCQNGTALYDRFEAAAVGADGSFILTGTSSGNWSGLSHGSADFIVLKIDSMGNEVWRWQVSGSVYSSRS